MSPSLDTVTQTERALQTLRRDVLLGDLAPGEKLKLERLQDAYGLSSSPLREALNRLAQEGLVRADERRGFRVADVSVDDLNDILRMRILIDLPALQDAIGHGDDAWESEVVAAFHQLELIEARLGAGPIVLNDDWTARHRRFHLSLLAACRSSRQLALSASLFDQAERYRRLSARLRTSARRKDDDHRRLMQAVLARDIDTACMLLEEHMRSTKRHIEDAISKIVQSQT